MYRVPAEVDGFLRLQLAESGPFQSLAITVAPEERVVFLATVQTDDGPELVVVRVDGHSRRPDYVDDGQFVGAVQRLYPAFLRGAQGSLNFAGPGYGITEQIFHRQLGSVLTKGTATSGNEFFGIKH